MQLVINTYGASIRKHGEQFLISAGPNKVSVSAHKVQSILLTTAVQLTTDALELAVAHNIDVLLLDRFGNPIGRFWQTRIGNTAAIRRKQLEVADQPAGLAFAKNWISAKLRHQHEFLTELLARRPGAEKQFAPALSAATASLKQVADLAGSLAEQRQSLMGLEGAGARAYFDLLSQIVPAEYKFTGRSRQPAQDGFNAMLNYAYGVLYGHVERACILAGLDPCIGFLHTDNYQKPSLVFDLIESFRILADRAVVLLFTGRRVKQEFFEPVPGGVTLTKEGKAGLLTPFNERLERAVRYPVQNKPGKTRNIKQRDVIQFEAHGVANQLMGRNDIPRIVDVEKLFAEDRAEIPDETETDDDPTEPPVLSPDPEGDQC